MTSPPTTYNATAFQIDKKGNGVRRAVAVLFFNNTIAASIHLPGSRSEPADFHFAFLREHMSIKTPSRVVVVAGIEAHKLAENCSIFKAWERYGKAIIATFDTAPPEQQKKMIVDERGQGLLFGLVDSTAKEAVHKPHERIVATASVHTLLKRIGLKL